MNTNDDLPFGNTYNQDFNINIIPTNRRYWFVRTFGGKLFDYYYDSNLIGITGNTISLDLIKKAHIDDSEFKLLKTSIQNTIFKEDVSGSEATKLAKQLINFHTRAKNDDIVIIPSSNSDYLAFGKIISDVKQIKKGGEDFIHNNKLEEYPINIRIVKWLKVIHKSDLVGDLKNIFNSHLGITNADEYGDFIESNLSTTFIKENQCFTTLYINQNEDINAFELKRFLDSITILYTELCKELGYEPNEELYIKIKVQSRGSTILIGSCISACILLGAYVFTYSNNVTFKGKVSDVLNVEFKSNGNPYTTINESKVAEAQIRYLNDSINRKNGEEELLHEIKMEQLKDSLRRIKNKTIDVELKNIVASMKELQVSSMESTSLMEIKNQ